MSNDLELQRLRARVLRDPGDRAALETLHALERRTLSPRRLDVLAWLPNREIAPLRRRPSRSRANRDLFHGLGTRAKQLIAEERLAIAAGLLSQSIRLAVEWKWSIDLLRTEKSHLAACLERCGFPDAASEVYSSAGMGVEAGSVFLRSGDLERAVSIYHEHGEFLASANAYLAAGMPDMAEREYLAGLGVTPDRPDLRRGLACLLVLRRDYAGALSNFEMAARWLLEYYEGRHLEIYSYLERPFRTSEKTLAIYSISASLPGAADPRVSQALFPNLFHLFGKTLTQWRGILSRCQTRDFRKRVATALKACVPCVQERRDTIEWVWSDAEFEAEMHSVLEDVRALKSERSAELREYKVALRGGRRPCRKAPSWDRVAPDC